MGRDVIVATGAAAVLVVGLVYFWPEISWALRWPRRYYWARAYDRDRAAHTALAVAVRADLDTMTIPRAEVAGAPPWDMLDDPTLWQSDLERDGRPLPAWADPGADRVSLFGLNSGSAGSDYGGGVSPRGRWPGPAGNGTGDPGRGAPGSEPSGAPGPAPLDLPPGWSQPQLPFDDPDGRDARKFDDTWDRLVNAWGGGLGAPSPDPRSKDAPSSPAKSGPAVGQPPAGPGSEPTRPPDPAVVVSGAGWAPTRLGTRFDAELAADVSKMIRDMDRECSAYLDDLAGSYR